MKMQVATVECPRCGEDCPRSEIHRGEDTGVKMLADRCAKCIKATGSVETTGVDEEEAEAVAFVFGGKLG